MRISDFQVGGQAVSRLNVLKGLISAFVQKKKQGRFAVIAFGETAHLWVPSTYDSEFVVAMIQRLSIGVAGDGTALGDALGLAVSESRRGAHKLNSLEDTLPPPPAPEADNTAIILFTDGENTAGSLEPYESARLAKDRNIPVYTVFLRGSATVQAGNNTPGAAEQTMQDIANATGARHYRASDTDALQHIMDDIGAQTVLVEKTLKQTRQTHWYWLPTLFACLLLALKEALAWYHRRRSE